MIAPTPIGQPTLGPMRGLDRASEKRADEAWLAGRIGAPSSRCLLLVDLKLAVAADPRLGPTAIAWRPMNCLEAVAEDGVAPILLGLEADGSARFAVCLGPSEAARFAVQGSAIGPLAELRALAVHGSLGAHELAIAGQARAMAAWHRTHRCCGRCGARTVARHAGWQRQCWACGTIYFPRSDPAVIMLVTHGQRCLLAHHRRFDEPRYTVLAGFVEPGEDIEDCVRREVREESGVRVGAVRYLGSQPWPFPHNLMIGCRGEALTTDLTLDQEELVDAVWADRGEARMILDGNHPRGWVGPGPFSIAHMLIRSFIENADPGAT